MPTSSPCAIPRSSSRSDRAARLVAVLALAGLGGGLGLVQMGNLVRATRVGARVGRGTASGLQTFSGSAGGLLTGALGGVLDAKAVFLSIVPLFAWLAARERGVAVSSAPRAAPGEPGTAPSRSPASASGP